MIDREKVISAIENCIGKPKCRDCPWDDCEYEHEVVNSVPYGLLRDALALLKEQEAENRILKRADVELCYLCGSCRTEISYRDDYCRHCGRSVNWE